MRRQGKRRWTRGHAIWASDVFAWRGSPAAWKEDLFQVVRLTPRVADADERKQLRRLGDKPVTVTLAMAEGGSIDVAVTSDRRFALLGPFAANIGAAIERGTVIAPALSSDGPAD